MGVCRLRSICQRPKILIWQFRRASILVRTGQSVNPLRTSEINRAVVLVHFMFVFATQCLGSCWAFGAVEAMSDRICIASHGELQVSLSADDLLSCCRSCGFGCNGGDPLAAWRYWVKEGIVTGSNFTANSGCKVFPVLRQNIICVDFQPYPFPPCEHHSKKTHYDPCPHDLYPTPKCEKKCVSDYTDKTYAEDKFFGASAYGVADDVEAIQKELMTHGPLEIAFEVYEDFLNYDGGVYVVRRDNVIAWIWHFFSTPEESSVEDTPWSLSDGEWMKESHTGLLPTPGTLTGERMVSSVSSEESMSAESSLELLEDSRNWTSLITEFIGMRTGKEDYNQIEYPGKRY